MQSLGHSLARRGLGLAAVTVVVLRALVCALVGLFGAGAATAAEAAEGTPAWSVVGRQGILIHVIVPMDEARNRQAYEHQVALICGAAETCFVNFYTNSTGATPTLPLPDAIAGEPTAVLRRSAKQGTEGFRFSCRMGLPVQDCF